MIDVNEVVKNLTTDDIKEIMTSIGGENYIEHKNEIIFPTICHNHYAEDGSHKLYYYKNSKLFVCYTCCGTFNIAKLLQKRYEILNQDYDFYKDIVLRLAKKANYTSSPFESSFYQPYDLELDKYQKKKIIVNLKHLNPNILNTFITYPIAEWLDDGITEEAMRHYQIGYSIIENKVIIPHYNREGYLIGVRGRALDPDEAELNGKYRPIVVNGEVLSHPLGYNLYGLNFVAGNIKRIGMAIIAESEKSCLQYMSYFGSHDNIVVAACGSNISDYQINLLLNLGVNRILIAFDKEGTNWKEKDKYYNKLMNFCKKYQNKVKMGFIWDSNNILKLKESPMDRGGETFLKLYWQNTVWI